MANAGSAFERRAAEDAKAIPQFEAVLKQQPNVLPALMLLGASFMRTGQPAKAVPVLERAMTLAPEDAEGRSMLADALLMLDRYDSAIPHLRKLAALDAGNPRVWFGLVRSYESVSQQAFAALEKQTPPSAWWLALAAEARLKQGRRTAAFTLYEAVLAKMPGFRGAHAGLAEIYRSTGHADWAPVEEERELKLGALPCAQITAECHFAAGRFEQALAAARLRKTPEGYFWQSRAADALARDALSHLAKLPPSAELHQLTAEIYRNQGRHADAVEQWKAAIRMAPDNPRLEEELATAVYMNRDYPAAAAMARELLMKAPDVAELHFILGDSLMNLQELEQAIPALRRAVTLRKDYPAAHAVLGRALLQTGQAAQALPHLQSGLAADTDGSIYFQLSRAYQQLGDSAKAAEALNGRHVRYGHLGF